jgi:hypothetical protein
MKEINLNDRLKQRFENWILSRHGRITQELLDYHLEKAVVNRMNDWESGKPFPPVYVPFNDLQEAFDYEIERAVTTYVDKGTDS